MSAAFKGLLDFDPDEVWHCGPPEFMFALYVGRDTDS